MPCKRSETVTIPQTLMTFKASDPNSGLCVKYRIERLSEDRFSEVNDLMANVFIKHEVTCASLELFNDPDFDGRKSWIEVLNKRISLVCFKDGSDEICGFNLLEVLQKDSEKPEIEAKSKNLEDIVKVKNFIHAKADTYNRHGVDKFLHSRGLLIVPKYRGLGLSTKILKARIPLGRALGVKVSGTIFTSDVSQKTAAKAGFVEDFSVLYEDLRNKDPFVDFPNVSTPSMKFMSLTLD
uniref:N-acetyltransferase domain-containing protein n=1 Tax=Lutzomyia longipalpis TaxID=7200 RepID=A0A7G3B3Q1_LUTLO